MGAAQTKPSGPVSCQDFSVSDNPLLSVPTDVLLQLLPRTPPNHRPVYRAPEQREFTSDSMWEHAAKSSFPKVPLIGNDLLTECFPSDESKSENSEEDHDGFVVIKKEFFDESGQKLFLVMADALSFISTCKALRYKLYNQFRWVDTEPIKKQLLGGWKNSGDWLDSLQVVVFFLYLEESSIFGYTFTARRIRMSDLLFSFGCSKDREKMKGKWKIECYNGKGHLHLIYDEGYVASATIQATDLLLGWEPPEWISLNKGTPTASSPGVVVPGTSGNAHTYSLVGFEQLGDGDYAKKLWKATRPQPLTNVAASKMDITDCLIDGKTKSEFYDEVFQAVRDGDVNPH